jgi:hypothetical protein
MRNPVVKAIANAYRNKGYSTLRINFRGVGESSGKYENGIGEQEDVLSAVSYLKGLGMKKTDLSGYSFGTFVNLGAVKNSRLVRNMTMISPPVAFMEFGHPSPLASLKLVITGSLDEIAPADEIEKMIGGWNIEAALEIIGGADHFYTGFLNKLEEILSYHI